MGSRGALASWKPKKPGWKPKKPGSNASLPLPTYHFWSRRLRESLRVDHTATVSKWLRAGGRDRLEQAMVLGPGFYSAALGAERTFALTAAAGFGALECVRQLLKARALPCTA